MTAPGGPEDSGGQQGRSGHDGDAAEPDDREVDARFAEIVAHWDEPLTTSPAAPPASRPADVTGGWRVGDSSLPFIDGLAAVDGLVGADDDSFEPGPTQPLPRWREDPRFWAMLVALVAGPAIVLYVVVVKPVDSGWLLLAGIGLTVAGFVLGVMRQPYRRDDDDNDLGIRL